MAGIGVYWLTIEMTEAHDSKVAELHANGYDVTFFKTLDALAEQLKSRRVTNIVLGDEGPEVAVLKAIGSLNQMPEIQGAKLILSCSRFSPSVLRAAACDAFRDILPLAIEDSEWVQRFIFSTGTRGLTLPHPTPQLVFDHDSSFSIPARITWIASNRLRIESRIFPKVGTEFDLTGPLAQSMGVKSLRVQVLESEQTNLHYRFSVALFCSWEMPDQSDRVDETLALVGHIDQGRRIKTFLAIQSPALRASLIRQLEGSPFELRAALQKKSIVEEPRYFCPDLVVIENRLTLENHADRFNQMLRVLPKSTTILVIGDNDTVQRLSALCDGRQLLAINRIPVNLREYVLEKLQSTRDEVDQESSYLPSEHEFSLAELKFPSRLIRLHPILSMMAVPHPVGLYGLARMESEILKKITDRYPYGKIVKTYKDQRLGSRDFPYIIECYFCDISPEDRKDLGKALSTIADRQLKDGDLNHMAALKEILDEKEPAIEIPQEAPQKEEVKPLERKGSDGFWTRDNVMALLMFCAVAVGTAIALIIVQLFIEPRWEKSGKEITDSLKIYREQ